jgi:hypothetical protein
LGERLVADVGVDRVSVATAPTIFNFLAQQELVDKKERTPLGEASEGEALLPESMSEDERLARGQVPACACWGRG